LLGVACDTVNGANIHGFIDHRLNSLTRPYKLSEVRRELYEGYKEAGQPDIAEAVKAWLDDLATKRPDLNN
jgi:hypothetical protein